MKQFLAMVLCLACLLSLAACGTNSKKAAAKATSAAEAPANNIWQLSDTVNWLVFGGACVLAFLADVFLLDKITSKEMIG